MDSCLSNITYNRYLSQEKEVVSTAPAISAYFIECVGKFLLMFFISLELSFYAPGSMESGKDGHELFWPEIEKFIGVPRQVPRVVPPAQLRCITHKPTMRQLAPPPRAAVHSGQGQGNPFCTSVAATH